jgi:uncharacterized protein with PIN domain
MLGTIAKKLRILGFDCKYSAAIDDEDLILIAKKENRAVITKDHKLAHKAKKHDIPTVELYTPTEKEQMIEIAKTMSWRKYEFSADSARCSVCNGTLSMIEKCLVADRLPPKIAQNIEEFWACQDCNHIYWKGTHIRNLEKVIAEINGQL